MKEALSSGATIEANVAPIQLGFALFQEVMRAFKRNSLSADTEVNNIADLVGMDILTTDSVVALIMECANTAIYTKNGKSQKVTWQAFEDDDNRSDFVEMLKLIAEKNITVFFPKARTK